MGMLDDFVGALDTENGDFVAAEELSDMQEVLEKRLKYANNFTVDSSMNDLADSVVEMKKEMSFLKRDYKAMKWKAKRKIGKR